MLILLVLSTSGCAVTKGTRASGPDENKVRTFAEVYRRAKEAGFTASSGVWTLGPDTGIEKPYMPVYEPPRVVKVWIPAHVAMQDKDIMVAGHWTFVVVTPSHWYIEDDSAQGDTPVILPGVPHQGVL
ncbi:MAG: hypothetical protein HQL17_03330 [Candidatus Omnitrophica bacterium]|nr:hypothetical protein [Candidatus Omnitrophota bacterium]